MSIISLKENLDALDQRDSFTRRCIEWWVESLGAVDRAIFPLYPAAAEKCREDWEQLCACLTPVTTDSILRSVPRLSERVMANYAQEVRRAQREDWESVKQMLDVLGDTATSAQLRSDAYRERFGSVSENIQEISVEKDHERMRQGLATAATALRECVTQMAEENRQALARMEQELAVFRNRLAQAEEAASRDTLTGLANRRELERDLQARIEKGVPFCALLFDVDEFKSINDRFGHDVGDEMLRIFARILNEQVRPGDLVARWGGDEFYVLLECGLQDAFRRSEQIARKLAGRYPAASNGRMIHVQVKASNGVVEYHRGESALDLFRRADAAMYAAKAHNRRSPAHDAPTALAK